MSISISNITLSSNFNLSNTSGTTTILRDFKINGRYIDKIYWCDPNIFGNQPDNCGLIYKRYSNIIPVILSGQVFDILSNIGLDNATITLDRLYTRVPSSWVVSSYSLDEYGEDPGYYYIPAIYGNSTYKVTVQRKGYATYIDTGYSLKTHDTIQNFYINPIDESISRILLYWNQSPADLDLFVICPDGDQLSIKNDVNAFGYVNVTQNNQYGPEIISLNTYVNFDNPLKVGGTFDIYGRWVSDTGTSMNSEIKMFTQQFGVQTFKNDPTVDNINRSKQFWNAAKLHVKSGIDSIQLSDQDLITFTVPLDLDILQQLGTQISYYTPYDDYSYQYEYPGVIQNTIDNNQIILYENAIFYLLKDYPFITKLVTSSGQINNYNTNITDNYQVGQTYLQRHAYSANINFSNFNIKSTTVSAYFYLNETMKENNQPFAVISGTNITNKLSINVRNIFYNKSIPLIILDNENKPLKQFQYRFINQTYYYGYVRQRYIIRKHLSQNQYFLIKNILKNNCKFKFTLGVSKQISIQDLVSNNGAQIPSSFSKIYPFIYHNTNELNQFKIKSNVENTQLFLYGNVQHYNQRYFNQQWLSNCNNFYDYYEEDYGYDDGYNFINKLNDFYLYDYYYNFSDEAFFTNNKRRSSFIEQKDEYKIHLLNYNNYVSGMTIPLSSINVQYINREVQNIKSTAGNKYFKFEDLNINDTYLVDSISSTIHGKLNYTYQWNPNGVNISFIENAPRGQNCLFTFKRLYHQIPRQELWGMYQPKVYIKNKNNTAETLKYGVSFAQNTLITDFYEQISGMTKGFDYSFIDFNRMYKLKTQLIDNYTADFKLNINFQHHENIKQYIGYKVLIWQNDSSKIIRSYQGMSKDSINIHCPQLISNKNYKVDIYTTYRRYHGNLSGIYDDGYQNYTYRYQYDEDYYAEYAKREFTQNIFLLDSFVTNVAGSGITLDKNYTLPYGQFYGTIYTIDEKQLNNDADGIAILKHEDFDIEYNCAWKDSKIWSIDYIYPGTYYFQVKYSGKLIYSEYIIINKDNISDTINKKFRSSAGFKQLKINIFNEQTKQLALCPQSELSSMWYDNYYDTNYKLRVLTKQNLLQDNIISNLTNNIKYIDTTSADDQLITKQAYIDSIYSFALSAADHLSIPINKLTHGSQIINATIQNNSALIYISDQTLKSDQTISIWTPYWYWRQFEMSIDTWSKYGYYYYFNGLTIDMYDQNDNLVQIAENTYITKYYISDIDKICEYSAWKDDSMIDHTYVWWYTDNWKNYQKTGQYKLKYVKKFGNSDKNTNVFLTEQTINIYDNGYCNQMPTNFPYKYIKIKPTFLKDQNGLRGCLNTTFFNVDNIQNIASNNNINNISSLLSSNLYGYDNQISGTSYSSTLSCMFYGNTSALSGILYYRLNNNEILTGVIEKNNININNNKFEYNLTANIKNKNNTSSCSIVATLSGILVNGINCNIPNNTFLSIPVFCGNSENISDYEIADYYSVYHNMTDQPPWTDWWYGGYDGITDKIYIIDQINYWIGAFDIFTTGNADNPLNIIGLYPTSTYVNNTFIQQNAKSIGYQDKCGQYDGMVINGNAFDHTTEYIMLLGTTNKIAVGGYVRDNNGREWRSITFDINVYKQNNSQTPIVQLKNISNERFDLGLIDKGTYKIEMFIANTSINVLNPEDANQTWNQSTTNSTLFRTSINIAYLTSRHYYKLNNTNKDVPNDRISFQLQLLNDKLKHYSQIYANNQDYYYSNYNNNLIAGQYKVKYKWNLTSVTLNKSDLNINGNKFSISQEKLKSYIPSSYKQSTGQLCLGTILDSNNNIAFYNSTTTNNILSGQFIKSNISLPDSIKTCICQQEAVSSITLSPGDNSINHVFDYAWGRNIDQYEFRDIPSNSNNKIICKSNDQLILLSANGTKLSANDIWIKCGTQLNLTIYHDQLKIGEATTTFYNYENKDFNYSYQTADVSANFIDKITNKKLEMNYSYRYDNGSLLTRNMLVYHLSCDQNIDQTSGSIIKNNIYYNYKSTRSINESPVIAENLYANENYLITYTLGNDGQLSASTMISNLPAGGLSKTFIMPYGCIRLGKYFIDKNNNSNSINSSYATLTLIRQQNDGYDTTYTYDGQNRRQDDDYYNQHIKTGLYKIKLQSNIPGKMPVTIQYQKLNMLSSNFDLTNYINTNPATINCSIINQSNISMPLTIRIWHNDLIYAERTYSSNMSNSDFSLFNIPFALDIINTNGNIVEIKNFSLGKSSGTSYEIKNNKISFETSNKSEDFIITI